MAVRNRLFHLTFSILKEIHVWSFKLHHFTYGQSPAKRELVCRGGALVKPKHVFYWIVWVKVTTDKTTVIIITSILSHYYIFDNHNKWFPYLDILEQTQISCYKQTNSSFISLLSYAVFTCPAWLHVSVVWSDQVRKLVRQLLLLNTRTWPFVSLRLHVCHFLSVQLLKQAYLVYFNMQFELFKHHFFILTELHYLFY